MLNAKLLQLRNFSAGFPHADGGLSNAQRLSEGDLRAEVCDDLINFHVLKRVGVLRPEYNRC